MSPSVGDDRSVAAAACDIAGRAVTAGSEVAGRAVATGTEVAGRAVSVGWDIVRYVPVAIVLDGPSLVPQLTKQGRQHVRNARALGPVALRRIERQLRGNFGDIGTQAADLLRVTGLVPAPAAPSGEPDGSTNGDGSDSTMSSAEAASTDPAPAATDADGAGSSGTTDESAAAVPGADVLAIPDYDSLSAMQVVKRLPGLASDELAAVRDYEASHRGRKTILNRVAQLQQA